MSPSSSASDVSSVRLDPHSETFSDRMESIVSIRTGPCSETRRVPDGVRGVSFVDGFSDERAEASGVSPGEGETDGSHEE